MKSNQKFHAVLASMVLVAAVCFLQIQCTNQQKPAEQKQMTQEEMVTRGKYIVTAGACNDCHSPKIFTQMGPVADTTKLLSGFPASNPLPPLDTTALHPGYWYLGSPDLMAWVGPWGISYAANLTPDSSTGLGAWKEENFVDAMRTGKHLGMSGGRQILPPMPWNWIATFTDDDLKSIYWYLRSIPAISNQVPTPVAPPDVMAMTKKK
jgi:hypothetical protein